MNKPENVDVYIADADIAAQPIMNELRKIITTTIPAVEEGISYNVPFYKYYGQFVGFSVAKKHVSFGYGSDIVGDEERVMLENQGYKLGKGTLQIKFDQSVPVEAIKQILIEKAKRNEAEKK